jgi:hypothetical protein
VSDADDSCIGKRIAEEPRSVRSDGTKRGDSARGKKKKKKEKEKEKETGRPNGNDE